MVLNVVESAYPYRYLDQLVEANKPRCYVRPRICMDPEHHTYYLEYGVKAQNWQDATAFWREWETFTFPETVNYLHYIR
jgi:hypothetical protein